MNDAAEVARLLDILGNRNRRRIIELLRQKPCFVTEISDTLVLSPKAVIDHLQMLEREEILSCEMDERRRKYYYLANDILINVSLKGLRITGVPVQEEAKEEDSLRRTVAMLGRMIQAHDRILENLEQINHDIEMKITDLAHNHKDLFRSEREISVIIALSHHTLAIADLVQVTGIPEDRLLEIVREFTRRGIVQYDNDIYSLGGIHAE
jgi:ArsR family transcriptional regulator